MGPFPVKLTERLDCWAAHSPERVFVGARDAAGNWRTLTYREFRLLARNVAEALLERGLTATRPVVILSGNDLEHALLALGAMYAGIPYAPVSPAYSLLDPDFTRLKRVLEILDPQLVFAANGCAFRYAIRTYVSDRTEVVVTEEPSNDRPATLFSALTGMRATAAVDRAHDRVHAGTVAKILFTSGSTGAPKGVINTQLMLTGNQEMLRSAIPSLAKGPPVLCDWLPWHHTFGGNHNFGLALYNGGTLYIDSGKPTAEAFAQTVRNLMEVPPTVYFNVPKGFGMLAEALRGTPGLRERFFSRLEEMFCAAAVLPRATRDELETLAVETCGRRIPLITGFGCTETGPLSLSANEAARAESAIGLPAPGVEIKLVPVGAGLELRVRGPNVTPGYWRDPELTREAFDEEGFYRSGDLVTMRETASESPVLLFVGRLEESFKLSSGTWVNPGPLRLRLIRHCWPLVEDAVIVGEGRDEVTALLFTGRESSAVEARAALVSFAQGSGSSNRIARVVIVADSLSLDRHERTDKGAVNRRAILSNYAGLVEDLYKSHAPTHIVQLR